MYCPRWLADVHITIGAQKADSDEPYISWAAYHASRHVDHEFSRGISTLLPLFPDDSKTAAMISHSLNIVKDAVKELNPDQVPFVTMDQPLYAIAKKLQWDFPDILGEDKCVVLLGGLHIEMAILKCLGDWLSESGLCNALVLAKIESPGKAEAFLKGSHVTRTRHIHQVTVCIFLAKAYTQYSDDQAAKEHNAVSIDEWLSTESQNSPTVQFWYLTMCIQLMLLVFIRSIREANCMLYMHTLTKLTLWMFALDHIHYARWLTVHIRDMLLLEENHPSLYEEITKGHFVPSYDN